MIEVVVATEADMRSLAAELGASWRAGDLVFLEGPLGVGKTTFVRGLLEALGVTGPVRSPTYNLIQLFATDPPVMHADLYRVSTHEGIGIEDYLGTHLCLIEWPDRAEGLAGAESIRRLRFEFVQGGRRIQVL